METKEYEKITLNEMQTMLALLEPWDNTRRMLLVPFGACEYANAIMGTSEKKRDSSPIVLL